MNSLPLERELEYSRPVFGRERPFERPIEVLPQQQFVYLLQHEKQRTDRSQAPLSLVVFRFDEDHVENYARSQAVIDAVSDLKRDTDIIGYLDQGSIGVLLLDTTNEGAYAFLRRVVESCERGKYVATVYTHPHNLFHVLLAGTGAPADPSASVFCGTLPAPRAAAFVVKRTMDIVIAAACLIVLSPVMLTAALSVAVTSPGPIIFRQERLGRGGIPFVINKFRSMVNRADDGIHREHVKRLIAPDQVLPDEAGETKAWANLAEDPRITRVGRVMRRTKIDELPQLFNVLKGDLSLVGPRPALKYEVEQYQPWHLRRILRMKPGVTGLWQVEGNDTTTFDDMVRMDIRYVEGWSLRLDLKILLKTAWIVLQRLVEPMTARRSGGCRSGSDLQGET